MPEVTPLPAEVLRGVSSFARALVAAGRSRALYPPEHPAVRDAVERLAAALREAGPRPLSVGVTPDTLLVDEAPLPAAEGPVREAAAWLHERDIVRLVASPAVPTPTLLGLLALMAEDPREVRARGGPAAAWAATGLPGIHIEQLDFTQVLEDPSDAEPPARRKDDVWRAIVQALLDRRRTLDDALQRRLLDIAADIAAIGELAGEVMAPNCAADGSPMLTSQAAAVLAAYRHLAGIVDVMAPDRRDDVIRNLAAATSALDPRVVLEMLAGRDDRIAPAHAGADVRRAVAGAFDDLAVARLLATTLALDGQATGRLAEVFDTIAPDEPRKRRVLTLARSLLKETAFGRATRFDALWTSMEDLLLTYNERPFVSGDYGRGLDAAAARAEVMAAEIPEDLRALVDTLSQDNVRRLSITLLIDLLRLERDPANAPALARDVAAFGEDLLLAGDFDGAAAVTGALAEQAARPGAVARDGSRQALDAVAGTPAFVETIEALGGMGDDEAARVTGICERIGPAVIDALSRWLDAETPSAGQARATAIIRRFGSRAVTRLAPLVSHSHWYGQRNAADLLGAIGSAEAVPLLQPLLRGQDPRVTEAAIRALAGIDDPAAARAIHPALRAAAGEQRLAVIGALVAVRDARVVPMLGRILDESDAFGADHAIVLDTLGAIGRLGPDEAVPHVDRVMHLRRWFARRKARALKRASLEALRNIGSPRANAAIAAATGGRDRVLRRLARALGAQRA